MNNTFIRNNISYIIDLMCYLFCIKYNQLENNNFLNIFCHYCNKNIKTTDNIYCMYDKTFCTVNCRTAYLRV
jgi:hypothetical protein